MRFYAIGMIETYGYLPAIEALDAAVKSSNVVSVSIIKVGSNIVTLIFKGDVSSVRASVDSGVAAASRLGKVLVSHVIARPNEEVLNVFFPNQVNDNLLDKKDDLVKEIKNDLKKNIVESNIETAKMEELAKPIDKDNLDVSIEKDRDVSKLKKSSIKKKKKEN